MTLDEFRSLAQAARAAIGGVIRGQEALIDAVLTALFARGHVLLEGPPGTAKTLLAQCFGRAASLRFGRVQFTPDLMPGDVLGVNLFNFQTNAFTLTRGPIFTDILLADEINRAPPKTQAALLQAMNEREVTIDGVTHALGEDFFVLATQNPIESHGTYPLPEAQLDRFLFKLIVDFPDKAAEVAILQAGPARPATIAPVLTPEALAQGHALVQSIRLDPTILTYIVELIRATRATPDILHGASTRAAAALAGAVRARAALEGRDYGLPDDVQRLFVPVLRHRIVLGPSAEIEGRSADEVLVALMNRQDAPR